MSALAATELRLLDERDLPWLQSILDVAEHTVGQPWRVLLERLDQVSTRGARSRMASVTHALRRLLGGTPERAKLARKARALVLGHPVFDRESRHARFAAAAASLELTPAQVEEVLWADLARERRVAMPDGRPSERSLAALANLDRIERAVRRARSIRLRAWDDAHELVRKIARYGLLAEVTAGDDGETVLDVTGPLALFHETTVYGRALSALVPLVADQRCFTLDIHCELDGIERILHVEPPVLLPGHRSGKRRRTLDVPELLARELERAGHVVERRPPPIRSGKQLLFSDLVTEIDGRRWQIEVVGFSTAEYLERKLSHYAAAGERDVVLCIDATRTSERVLDGPRRVPFYRSVVLEDLERAMQ
ncbi:MAG TPA: DUF790 family protein [Kofleriaceae bacterium]|nr:DUF790 family protein [Kofleriaceae bacterium]